MWLLLYLRSSSVALKEALESLGCSWRKRLPPDSAFLSNYHLITNLPFWWQITSEQARGSRLAALFISDRTGGSPGTWMGQPQLSLALYTVSSF